MAQWQDILREAFSRNARKVVHEEDLNNLYEQAINSSLTAAEMELAEEAQNPEENVIVCSLERKARHNAMLNQLNDDSYGIYSDDKSLYLSVLYLEHMSHDDDVWQEKLPESLAQKLALAMAATLDQAEDFAPAIASGRLHPSPRRRSVEKSQKI